MKGVKRSSRLKHLEEKLRALARAANYLEKELKKVRTKEAAIRKKASRERKAIALVNRAKRLR